MHCKPIDSIQSKQPATEIGTKGFTLMEILTAMFIFSIVIGLILGSFEGVFSNADHMNAITDLFEMGNSCLNRMTKDLESIHVMHYPRYQVPDIDAEPDIYRVEGSVDSTAGSGFAKLRFTSLAHLSFNQDQRDGIAQIVYYVQKDKTDQFVLRRSDNLYPYPDFETDPTDPILCEQVRSLEIGYYPIQGDRQEEWDSESDDCDYSTPQRIGIRLVIGSEDASVVFATEMTLPMVRFKKVDR